MRFLSLFAGIGGFDLGLERAGMTCAGQVEIDPFCNAVLAKHWPDVKRMPDIREVQGDEFGPIDVVCGGFPCQPWSVAGKRGGTEDDRDLWPEMRRIIESVQPRWVVGENVPGLDDERFMGLDRVLSDLEGLGYQATAIEIPACAVDAPHRRARLWIVAHGGHARSSCTGRKSQSRSAIVQSRNSHRKETLAHGARHMQPEQKTSGTDRERVGTGGDEDVEHAGRRRHGNTDRQIRAGWHGAEHAGDVEHATKPGRYTTGSASETLPQPGTVERSAGRSGGDVGDAAGPGLQGARAVNGAQGSGCAAGQSGLPDSPWSEAERINGRRVKPGVRLLAHGIPRRVDQLRALGNAVVPQVVERIGRAIMEASDG